MIYKAILIGFIVFNISCTNRVQEPFTFIQLCDTQLGMGGYKHDIKTFEQAVRQINILKPDFAVICGDLVHDATDSSYADFKRIMSGFQVPCYLAAGNHDVGRVPNDTTLQFYRETIGDDYFTFRNKGCSFVVTNTQFWKVEVPNESKKHHQWVVNVLDSLGKGNDQLFVIGHYPIFLKTPDEEEVYFNLPIEKRKELLALFRKNKVRAYLSGHKHETVINVHEKIQFVSGETTSRNFDGRPMGFRLWEVAEDTILHRFVPLVSEEGM